MPSATYYRWKDRQQEGNLADRVARSRPKVPLPTPNEVVAVRRFALAHPKMGYKRLTWQMVDETGRPLDDELLPFPRLMQSGEPIYDLQQVVELPPAGDGPRRLHLSMNAAPLFDASGEPDGVIITVFD